MQTTAAKFWAALFLVAANGVRSYFGVDLGLDPMLADNLAGGLIAASVWAVPNRAKA